MTQDTPLYQLDPTNRFSNRTQDYNAYRPTYPAAAIDIILAEITPQTVADIGAGTGIAARLLADRGLPVWAVEPNAAMRSMGTAHPRITTWDGTAEQTGLDNHSMDLVTSFQAFHWFKHDEAFPELHRILRPNGRLAIVWNNRDRRDEFTKRYGQVLQSVSSKPVGLGRLADATPIREETTHFTNLREFSIPHQQALTLEALIGLAKSRSYTPQIGEARDLLFQRLTELHREFADPDGLVYIQYHANIFLADPRSTDP